MTAAELITARDTLQQAIYSGQLRVRFSDGREIMYQSITEMKKALEMLDAEIAQAATVATEAPKTSYAWFDRA